MSHDDDDDDSDSDDDSSDDEDEEGKQYTHTHTSVQGIRLMRATSLFHVVVVVVLGAGSMETDEIPAVKGHEKVNDYFSRCKDFWLDKAEEVCF